MRTILIQLNKHFNNIFNKGQPETLKSNIISIIILMLLFVLVFTYFSTFTLPDLLAFLFVLSISALITTFIINNFKFSTNFIIRVLQKFIFLNLFIILCLYTLDYFNIVDFNIYCDTGDNSNNIKALQYTQPRHMSTLTHVSWGSGALQKYGVQGCRSLHLVECNTVPSVLELGDSDIPLEVLLHHLISLSIIELFCILMLIYLFIYHYVNRYTSKLNVLFINKLFSFFNFKSKTIDSNLEKAVSYNERFIYIMLILTFILLIIIKIGHILVSAHLFSSIDSYVKVYNMMINSKSLIFLSTTNLFYSFYTNIVVRFIHYKK